MHQNFLHFKLPQIMLHSTEKLNVCADAVKALPGHQEEACRLALMKHLLSRQKQRHRLRADRRMGRQARRGPHMAGE